MNNCYVSMMLESSTDEGPGENLGIDLRSGEGIPSVSKQSNDHNWTQPSHISCFWLYTPVYEIIEAGFFDCNLLRLIV